MSSADALGDVIDAAGKAKAALDMAAKFSPMMGPAAPYVTIADLIANVLLDAVTAVHGAHGGGKSWIDSMIETLQHLSPTQPNSLALSPAPVPDEEHFTG